MAETERRSKPRKIEPKEDESKNPKGHGLVLLGYFVAAIAIVMLMFVIATFLAKPDSLDTTTLYLAGGTAVLAGILFTAGKLAGRKQG